MRAKRKNKSRLSRNKEQNTDAELNFPSEQSRLVSSKIVVSGRVVPSPPLSIACLLAPSSLFSFSTQRTKVKTPKLGGLNVKVPKKRKRKKWERGFSYCKCRPERERSKGKNLPPKTIKKSVGVPDLPMCLSLSVSVFPHSHLLRSIVHFECVVG